MVTEASRRETPAYALPRIRKLAEAGAVDYAGRRVQQDVENLSYAPEDVHGCLSALNECHFHHAVQYQADGPWADVYIIPCRAPEGTAVGGVVDRLYVKLKLDRDRLRVVLLSFHRER